MAQCGGDLWISIYLHLWEVLQPLEGVTGPHDHRNKAEAVLLNTDLKYYWFWNLLGEIVTVDWVVASKGVRSSPLEPTDVEKGVCRYD